MATVSEILSAVSTRINEDADLYDFINMSIRMIAKRLFQMGSSIIIEEMEVPIYAAVGYTASTIAFEVTDPDTIVDSANGLVTAGFVAGMYITTDDVTNPGPFQINSVAVGALTLVGTSPVLSAVAEGASITITSVYRSGNLPSDFWGLVDKPYVSGETEQLEPLPSQLVELAYSLSPGVPAYYKIRGTKLYTIPVTSSDVTIKADYFARPDEVSRKDDMIPFNGFCDDIISEAVIMFYAVGAPAKAGLKEFINEQLDFLVGHMDLKGPKEFPQGIDWNAIN